MHVALSSPGLATYARYSQVAAPIPNFDEMQTTTARTLGLAFFTDVEQFRSIALPILESDTTFNTLALSALLFITELKPGVVLGLLSSSSNGSNTALVSPGFQGVGCQLYVTPAPSDDESAQIIAQQLPNLPCTTLSTTSAGAALLQQYCGWQEKHRMNVMLYQPKTSSAERAAAAGSTETLAAIAAAALSTAAAADTGVTDTAAAGIKAQSSSPRSSTTCTAALQLRSCSADNPADVQLVLQWAGEFLAQVFHLPSAPPAPQLQEMVLPRLQQGLYYVLYDSATAAPAPADAVCMACHVPTSGDSTRITMLYTPAAQRGRGYGKHTMRQLCGQLAASGYRHICLMADQAEPAVIRLYQGVGFAAVGDVVMLESPEQRAVEADNDDN